MDRSIIISVLIAGVIAATACGKNPDSSANDSKSVVPVTNGSVVPTPTQSRIPDARSENRDLTSPTPSSGPLPSDAPGVSAAIGVIIDYYAAINSRNYRKAFELWSSKGEASGQTFEQFRKGFSDTAEVNVDTNGEPGDLEGAAGSQYVTVPVRITARLHSGKIQHFSGEYVLRRSMVDGATADQVAWRIYSASIKER